MSSANMKAASVILMYEGALPTDKLENYRQLLPWTLCLSAIEHIQNLSMEFMTTSPGGLASSSAHSQPACNYPV